MNCKNCDIVLQPNTNYCQDCGAKVIRNRLTLKNLWQDFGYNLFNVDNTFFRTVKQLFVKPESVIDGYINGLRKKYLSPTAFFTFAISLSGFFLFIQQKFAPDAMKDFGTLYGDNQQIGESTQELLNNLFEYQSLIFFATIPFIALISRLVFLQNKKYNFTEHLVISTYGYSLCSICTIAIYSLTVWNSTLYLYITYFVLILQMLYFAYILKRIFELSMEEIILKTLLFLAIFFVLYILLIILTIVYLILFTDMFKEIFEAGKKEDISHLVANLKNWAGFYVYQKLMYI